MDILKAVLVFESIIPSSRAVQGITVWKCHVKLEQAAFPHGLVLPGYPTFPPLEIQHALRVPLRLREETERVITTPLLAKRGISRRHHNFFVFVQSSTYRSSWSRFWHRLIVAAAKSGCQNMWGLEGDKSGGVF